MTTLHEKIKAHEAAQIIKAVDWAGSQSNLASVLDVSPQVVSNWVKRGRISATAAAKLEEKTGGEFKKKDMRPDVKEWYL